MSDTVTKYVSRMAFKHAVNNAQSICNSNICIRLNASYGASSIDTLFFSGGFDDSGGKPYWKYPGHMNECSFLLPRLPDGCSIQRMTATFIRKSTGHIDVLFKNEKCILPCHYTLQTSFVCLY